MAEANYHVQYLDVTSQHWHPNSAQFAGGDHLLTAVNNGWEVSDCVIREIWYAGARCVFVYHFTLTRGNEMMRMPVIDNPYVTRFVEQSGVKVRREDNSANEKTA